MGEMSPFEVEVAEKRLISVLKYADEEEKDTIMGLIQSLTKIKPSNELVVTLLDYYIRIKDVENASQWLQRLEPSYLISSYNLVESVLESWLEQKGPKAPWRADEVFKAVTSKIRRLAKNCRLVLANEIVDDKAYRINSEDDAASF